MSYIVHLRKTQKGFASVTHPLFRAEIPKEDLRELVEIFLENKTEENREKVILKCLPLLRYTVGRFLRNWPIIRHLADDIIGEGSLSVCQMVDRLKEKHLEHLNSYILGNIRKAIEMHINDLQSLAAPRLKKNYEERRENGKPIYCVHSSSEVENIPTFNFEAELFEAFEIVEKLILTQDEREYFESVLNGNSISDRGKKNLQKRFEGFLRNLMNE